MSIPASKLIAKRSTIKSAGKGLFTKMFIAKGTPIVEYKGTITTWKEVDHNEGKNGYIFFVNRNHVIDANGHPEALARYANDARGLEKIKGLTNNAKYDEIKGKIFIIATRDIAAGNEIFVSYGKEYWDTIRYNSNLDKKKKSK